MVEFRFKLLFFDTKEIRSKLSEATRKVMSKFGAFVRATARQSIKTKPTSSAPGQPPHSHTGYLKKEILFGYDKTKESVVVGPVKLAKKGNAPEALEKGGEAVKRRNPRRKDRKIGDGGVILLRKTNSPASKTGVYPNRIFTRAELLFLLKTPSFFSEFHNSPLD